MPRKPKLSEKQRLSRDPNMPKTRRLRSGQLATKAKKKTKTPLWLGPGADGWNGGVTQSMLGGYLVCKERFRIRYIEGLQPADTFRKALEYGNMWHTCEEAFADERNEGWQAPLQRYCKDLMKKYPTQGTEINKWYNVCKVQFPLYVRHWEKQPDVKNRTPLMQEVAFDVPYKLPSGRVVRLRGKWDSVDIIGKGKNRAIYLMENKTKGEVDEQKIRTQLHFDLQTMLYLVALETWYDTKEDGPNYPLKGVRYNVIRRPLSGGKGSIKQKKGSKNIAPETTQEYYARLGQVIAEDVAQGDANTYFFRWKAEITAQDIERFKRECLDPVLENLCDDYEWWEYCCALNSDHWDNTERRTEFSDHSPNGFRFPYGIWNPITDGRGTDLDEYLATGSTLGLVKGTELFEELKDA